MKAQDLLNEIKVVPQKPVRKDLNFMDSIKGQLYVELKVDGIRCIVFKDPDDGYYKVTSSSGNKLGGNYKNILKELKPALDNGWVFSGEIIDVENPDDRGAALSVAKNFKHPPEKLLYIVWNTFQITPEMRQAGEITPDAGLGLPPYRKMRGDLVQWLRVLKPKQVKIIKRYKVKDDTPPSKIFQMVMDAGEEGIVAKDARGGVSYKMKGVSSIQIMPVTKFNYSDSATHMGKVNSVQAETPYGKIFDVGQGYAHDVIDKLTNLAKARNDNPDGLYVGFVGSKPAKPLEKGGVHSNPTFKFLSSDPEGKTRLVEEFTKMKALKLLKMMESGYAGDRYNPRRNPPEEPDAPNMETEKFQYPSEIELLNDDTDEQVIPTFDVFAKAEIIGGLDFLYGDHEYAGPENIEEIEILSMKFREDFEFMGRKYKKGSELDSRFFNSLKQYIYIDGEKARDWRNFQKWVDDVTKEMMVDDMGEWK